MSIVDFIHHNFFLKKIFPEGLSGLVRIGEFCLSDAGTFSMHIHTRQKPAIEIAKWGTYGEHYGVIVIHVSGSGAKNIKIESWVNADFAFFEFVREGENIRISSQTLDWKFDVSVASMSFQSCSTYIE